MSRAPDASRTAAGTPKPMSSPGGPKPFDLSTLPAAGFRSHGLWFWAGMAFMLMEGVAFALAGATYLYLMNGAAQWPLADRPPDLAWGTLQTWLAEEEPFRHWRQLVSYAMRSGGQDSDEDTDRRRQGTTQGH